jgi:hypothetical protein
METKNIYTKLFEAKKEIGKITKDSKNPFFKSNYFDVNSLLKEVEPILQKHKLLLLQPIRNGLVCTQLIDIETGECENSDIQLPNITDPQKLGSAITYYRRYTLQSLLGLQAEDDDGNKASKPAPKKDCTKLLNECKDLTELASVYTSFTKEDKVTHEALKNELKNKLTPKN